MRNIASVVAVARLCACAGYSSGTNLTGGVQTGGQSDGGLGGADGGDGGIDGGPDAGCAPLTLNAVGAIDNCPGGTVPFSGGVATVTVAAPDAGNACAVNILLNTGSTPCNGVATGGTLDAFSGACQGTGMNCTSPSLPGLLTCTNGTGGCTITICSGPVADGGVCGP